MSANVIPANAGIQGVFPYCFCVDSGSLPHGIVRNDECFGAGA
jgi:hypothetical protein